MARDQRVSFTFIFAQPDLAAPLTQDLRIVAFGLLRQSLKLI